MERPSDRGTGADAHFSGAGGGCRGDVADEANAKGGTERMEEETSCKEGMVEGGGGDGSGSNSESEPESQSNCISVMPFPDSVLDPDSITVSPEASKSDISEGRGGDDGMSMGNEAGTCIEQENDFAGAKSSSVKMLGLNGKMPVQAKADAKSAGVMDAARTSMYSGTTL
jgi:hypothetical protein